MWFSDSSFFVITFSPECYFSFSLFQSFSLPRKNCKKISDLHVSEAKRNKIIHCESRRYHHHWHVSLQGRMRTWSMREREREWQRARTCQADNPKFSIRMNVTVTSSDVWWYKSSDCKRNRVKEKILAENCSNAKFNQIKETTNIT
jgi:hypothetical protein